MAQVATVPVSLRSIIRSAHFVRGFKDAQKGKPFNYDYSPNDANGIWFCLCRQPEKWQHSSTVSRNCILQSS